MNTTKNSEMNMSNETAALASTLIRFRAAGIDRHACVLLQQLLRQDGLEAQWDSRKDRPQLAWRVKPGMTVGKFQAPDDAVAAIFLLFLQGDLIVSVQESPSP